MINKIKNIYAKLVLFFKGIYLMSVSKIKDWYRRLTHKQIQRSRKVTKAKFMYYYVIFGTILGFLYFITSIVLSKLDVIELHWHWSFTPVYLLGLWLTGLFLVKNRKLIWLYISDVDQGKLLLYLNKYTHFSEEHKMKLLNWVYLKRGTVRWETYNDIYQRILDKKDVSDEEKQLVRRKPVTCPQQLRMSFNEAMLVQALKYSHFNISLLDPDLREIMNLTDENLLAFDINKEAEKASSKKYQEMIKVGQKAAAKLNGEDGTCLN